MKNIQLLYVTPLKVLILKQSNLKQIFCCFLFEAGLGKENKQAFFLHYIPRITWFLKELLMTLKNPNTTTEVINAFKYNNFPPPKKT